MVENIFKSWFYCFHCWVNITRKEDSSIHDWDIQNEEAQNEKNEKKKNEKKKEEEEEEEEEKDWKFRIPQEYMLQKQSTLLPSDTHLELWIGQIKSTGQVNWIGQVKWIGQVIWTGKSNE